MNLNRLIQNIPPQIVHHFLALVFFLVLSLTYFYPVLEGKMIQQNDLTKWRGMAKEVHDYRDFFDSETQWTNSMYSGMPSYLISTKNDDNLLQYAHRFLSLGLPRPVNFFFLYLAGFYFLLICFRAPPLVAVAGAVGFAFSTYNVLIIGAGHSSKAYAIAYMAPVLASWWLTLRSNRWLGGVLFSFFLSLEIYSMHPQITYYFFLTILMLSIWALTFFWKKEKMGEWLKRHLILGGAVILAVLCSTAHLWTLMEYTPETIRGGTELTILPDSTSNALEVTSGLPRSEATDWSFGPRESWAFIIPDASGGPSRKIGSDSTLFKGIGPPNYQVSLAKYNTYWGDQRSVGGPVYFGVVLVFLFLIGIIIVPGQWRWWLIALLALSLLLSFGRHVPGLTNFLLDHLPGYNKFRALSMALVIAGLLVPFAAALGLKKIAEEQDWWNRSRWKILSVGGAFVLLLGALAYTPETWMDFYSEKEALAFEKQIERTQEQHLPSVYLFMDMLQEVRSRLFSQDAWRSLIFLLLALGWLVVGGMRKLNPRLVISGLGVLILVDLWQVDKRYLHNAKEEGEYLLWNDPVQTTMPYESGPATEAIFQQELDRNPGLEKEVQALIQEFEGSAGEPATDRERDRIRFSALNFLSHFRVFSEVGATFDECRTSWFFKSIGGCHAALMSRYQDLIKFHLDREEQPANLSVLRMLNTQYRIKTGPEVEKVDGLGGCLVGR